MPKKRSKKRSAPRKANVDFRHEAFAREYSISRNGTKAYKVIYGADLTDEVASAAASRLLCNVKVRAIVKRLDTEHAARFAVTKENVLREEGRISFSDPLHLTRADGTVRDFDEMHPDTRASIASIEVFEEFEGVGKERVLIGYTKKLKLWDKNTALNNLSKHLGLYEKDNAQKGDAIARLMAEVDGNVLRPAAG